jgi:hypothetical protein
MEYHIEYVYIVPQGESACSVCDDFVNRLDSEKEGGAENEWLRECVIFLLSFILKSEVNNL